MSSEVCRNYLTRARGRISRRTNERDDFRRFLGNFLPPELLLTYHPRLRDVGRRRKDWRALRVESQDLITPSQRNGRSLVRMKSDLHSNAGSPSALDLMFVSEQCNTSPPSSIVKCTYRTMRTEGVRQRAEERTAGENTKRCGLPAVYISDDRTTYLRDVGNAEGWESKEKMYPWVVCSGLE